MRSLIHGRRGTVCRIGAMLVLGWLTLVPPGCHTSLRRPPALCQCMEDRWGDCVDCKGRTTSISNSTLNHRTTQHYRSHRLTRALGRCIATGGPHCFR
jgi:hypothetical protein